ncbi:hypothetical protein [Belnapia rosea]|uniref:hypothetical protein n=1 Tax=Belnapia rosea TaxID=938405 RepID=UPI00159FD881|nr:hypothetical protein [Belnapia rosea]
MLDATLNVADAEMTAADGSLGDSACLPRRQSRPMRLFDRPTQRLGEHFIDNGTPAPILPGTIPQPGHHAV